jgi:hypothetical protein
VTDPPEELEGAVEDRGGQRGRPHPESGLPSPMCEGRKVSGQARARTKGRKGDVTTTQSGYGWEHQQLRKRVPRVVAAGGATCARCGLPITPGDPWDLGHDDQDRSR